MDGDAYLDAFGEHLDRLHDNAARSSFRRRAARPGEAWADD